MTILSIVLLVIVVVLMVLIIANVPISQKALNVLFLLVIALLIVNGAGWLRIGHA